MKNKRHSNRRGMAIEMAMAMMIIVFSLCALMTTVVTVSRKQTNIATARFTQTAQVDAIGESFVRAFKNDEPFQYTGTEFICNQSVDKLKLTVSKDGKTLLTVELNDDKTVKSWQH